VSVSHPFSCIREHEEHHDILKDISRIPAFMNVQTSRTSRRGPLDVSFKDWFSYKGPSAKRATTTSKESPTRSKIFSAPTAMWKSVKLTWMFVPSCALMAHGVGHYCFP